MLARALIAAASRSVPWDISTAFYSSVSLDVSSQATGPSGLFFKADGTALYVVDNIGNTVYQYTLSSAWDLSTASYASKSKSVASETSSPYGLYFKEDGAKMYVGAFTSNGVLEYALSTAWDVSTASYTTFTIPISGGSDLTGVALSSDGTKLYVVNYDADEVTQHTLSSAWDISSAGAAVNTLSVTSQATAAKGIAFKPDGTRMYICCSATDKMYQYNLSTPWDISTATYSNKSKSINSEDGSSTDLAFKADGTKVYMLGDVNDKVYQYTL